MPTPMLSALESSSCVGRASPSPSSGGSVARLAGIALFTVALASGLRAQVTTWINAGTGAWTTASNWDNGVPNASTLIAKIANGGPAMLSTAGQATKNLFVGDAGTSSLTITSPGAFAVSADSMIGRNGGNGTITVNSSGTFTTGGNLIIGEAGTGLLAIAGGAVTAPNTYLGHNGATSTGTVTLASGTFSAGNGLFIGFPGTGSLAISGGALTATDSYVGYSGGTGAATVSSGTWESSGTFFVGNEGTGSLSITGGALTAVESYLGAEGGTGIATVSSGSWVSSGPFFVGNAGTGLLTISGGTVSAAAANFFFGNRGGSATGTVSGGTLAAYSLVVGHSGSSGSGTLNISGGTVAVSYQSYIGYDGVGIVNVTSGIFSSASLLDIGVDAGGFPGVGTLTVSGGTVSSPTVVLAVDLGSTGNLNLNGGVLATGVIFEASGSGGGHVNFNGGTVRATGASANFINGFETGDVQLLAGGVVIDTQAFGVTLSSNATFALQGAGGLTKQGTGTLTVTGAHAFTGGTTISQGTLGLTGSGRLDDAGAVMVDGGTFGIGAVSDSVGAVTLRSGSITGTTGVLTGTSYAVESGTISARLGGSTGLNKTTSGNVTLTLNSASSYTGATTVDAGSLVVNGSAPGSVFTVNSGGTLRGSGSVGPLTIADGGRIAPGSFSAGADSPGKLNALNTIFSGGGRLLWEINNATGAAGPNWDFLSISGALTLTSTPANPFAISLKSLTLANLAGAAANFDSAANFTFVFATAAGGIGGFNASAFTIDTTGFQNAFTGFWRVAQIGNSLALVYSVGPIPATISLGGLAAIYDGTPKPVTATTVPAGLAVSITYDGSATAPANAGSYVVVATITDPGYVGSTTGLLSIGKAAQVITFPNPGNKTYGTAPFTVTATASSGLAVTFSVVSGPATVSSNLVTLTGAGDVALQAAQPGNANYQAAPPVTQSFTVGKANQTIAFPNPGNKTYGNAPFTVSATASSGLAVTFSVVSGPATVSGNLVTLTGAGDVVLRAAQAGNTNFLAATADVAFNVAGGAATVTLANLVQAYDGTPKSATATTSPAGLTVTFTYNGSATPPTLPGTYTVVATVNDGGYTGSATGTLAITIAALVRHAPHLNGAIDGSLQVLTAEDMALTGNAWVSGDILVPGTPTVRFNGHPTFAGTRDGTGSATASNYQVTLNGNALLRYLVRRTDPIPLPTVSAPPAPTGTRNVTLNSAGDSAGSFATLRNLTLSGNAGAVAVPAGTYGTFSANGSNNRFVLGVAGATTPAVYNFQGLSLNGHTPLEIVGPVSIVLASGASFNGSIGAAGHPGWLMLQVALGGVTLHGNGTFHGSVVAPSGTITLNGNSELIGTVACDRLTLDGNAMLTQPDPTP